MNKFADTFSNMPFVVYPKGEARFGSRFGFKLQTCHGEKLPNGIRSEIRKHLLVPLPATCKTKTPYWDWDWWCCSRKEAKTINPEAIQEVLMVSTGGRTFDNEWDALLKVVINMRKFYLYIKATCCYTGFITGGVNVYLSRDLNNLIKFCMTDNKLKLNAFFSNLHCFDEDFYEDDKCEYCNSVECQGYCPEMNIEMCSPPNRCDICSQMYCICDEFEGYYRC
jgi:hypothetical protein